MKYINSNRIIGLLMGLVSLGYLWMAFRIPTFPMPRPIDSDWFPKLLGIALLLLSILLCLEKQDTPTKKEKAPQKASKVREQTSQLLITLLAIAGYAFGLEWLGFVLASSLFGIGLSYCYGYRRHLISVVATLAVVLSLYLIMTRLLEVHLPRGLLPF
ncbi:TctB protein [Zobellella endophytica]|uniref:TctB protein n=1 Tax=Zobellella endophytica TaxID=2116700 RepID=A0A2P7R7Z4_9GAMM|nr:tripartite tricarboxylate transporter TctB family protein [Zobellella endophytica]PSJ46345.1 TctB protein [Zobellella endophytica]